MKNLIIASALASLLAVAGATQAKNIRPSKHTVEQAELENKLILVVSHAPQGGNFSALFGDKYLSQFLNRHFVIEKHASKSDGDSYLIYDQQRELVHRVAGQKYPYEVAVKIKRALDTRTQYYTLLARFDNGDRSADLLTNLIIGATDADDDTNAPRFMQAYLGTLSAQPTEADLRFIARHTTRSSDPGFTFLLERESGSTKLAGIIFQETFVNHLNDQVVDVVSLTSQAKSQYATPALASYIDRMPIELLEMREDWDALNKLVPVYLSTNSTRLSPAQVAYYNGLLNTHTAIK
ncbi:hypothetical protein GCM10007415_18120 [Parapedobacter pyrenivorans]|uniref:Uncharacterized protein n=1 Tax=Parapedobacter pyrenivorans TaxID=1305674 RepID=A0A917HPT7_9SPHI|nr:hypothetical protein [Parapedobacter pyrenivorans]GGG85172.1 hypothetical protein GCM10007415_18120 [Parapedobacter pyrenivorans]